MQTPHDDPVVESLRVNVGALTERVRDLEKQVDTLWTPPWKKLWFLVDGWPLYRVIHPSEKRRRPWDRWRRGD